MTGDKLKIRMATGVMARVDLSSVPELPLSQNHDKSCSHMVVL